jgi:archaellum component FlaC
MSDVVLGIISAVGGYLLSHFIDSFKTRDTEHGEDIGTLKSELHELSKNMIRLEGKIELLMDNIKPLQRLHKDVQELYGKVRSIEGQMKG